MPKNIVDAYRNAVSKSKRADFYDVVSFCESDEECQEDTSLKKNVLMFWSYKKIALFYEKNKKYKQAYTFWQKTLEFATNSAMKIKIGHKMLEVVNKMKIPLREKAEEIVRICNIMQKEYELKGNKESVLRMSKLQDAAEKILHKANVLH